MTQGFSIEFLIYINIVLVYHYKRSYHGDLITRNHLSYKFFKKFCLCYIIKKKESHQRVVALGSSYKQF